ncbi:MAG: DUF2986 domain-containing protein [Glaciecola sp.]
MSRKKTVINKLLKKARKANKNKQNAHKPRYVAKADRELIDEQATIQPASAQQES